MFFGKVVINLDAPLRPREERTAREAAVVVIDIRKMPGAPAEFGKTVLPT